MLAYQLTNKIDNIYAVLGLVKKAMPKETSLPFPVQVNYASSVEEVYKSFTALFIRMILRLVALSLVEETSFRKYTSLPILGPNYSYAFCPTPYVWFSIGGYFNASDTIPGRNSRHNFDGNGTLSLHGRNLFSISKVCAPMRERIRSHWLQPCLELCASSPQP